MHPLACSLFSHHSKSEILSLGFRSTGKGVQTHYSVSLLHCSFIFQTLPLHAYTLDFAPAPPPNPPPATSFVFPVVRSTISGFPVLGEPLLWNLDWMSLSQKSSRSTKKPKVVHWLLYIPLSGWHSTPRTPSNCCPLSIERSSRYCSVRS